MPAPGFTDTASRDSYDVIIIGGAVMGSSTAFFLTANPDFNGSVLVIERDPSFEFCSTAHTNSCIRQQFSEPLNVQISQFGAEFIHNMRAFMGGDSDVPKVPLHSYGYLYLADTPQFADTLRANQAAQAAMGAATEILTGDEIKARYPFYHTDDILLGTINTVNEGYFDGATMFDWLRRKARAGGVEYLAGEVTSIQRSGTRIIGVTLADGTALTCGQLVNASGPRAARTAAMAGLEIPVEPRKRFTWIFKAEQPLDRPLPLTIDPSGVHVRDNGGGTYLAGGHGDPDPAVAFDDFAMDHVLWAEHAWPHIATRIPQFEAVKVISEWAGHYAYNTFDQNAVIGPHPEVGNFLFLSGFSGHGLQQAPAMGRAMAEWITYGAFRMLDMTPFAYDRLLTNAPIIEKAVI